MVFINHFYNKQFLYKFLYINKFHHIRFINKKLLYEHTCNRCFTLSVSAKNDKEIQKLPKSPNPIFEKFEKMLNDLSVKQGNDIEFPTNFGSVRFDSDVNFTWVNKLSDKCENSESSLENTENFIEDSFFENSVSQSSYEMDKDKLNIVQKVLKDQDLNYIDDQYMKAGSIGETNTSNNYNSEMKPDSSSLNYIDSQIAGLSNQEVRTTESDLSDNQIISETKLNVDDNVAYTKEKLSCYYSFEDSINENVEENFTKKVINYDSNVKDEEWRVSTEARLLSLTEEGSKYLRDLNKSQDNKQTHELETKDKVIEPSITNVDFEEQELKEEHQSNVKSALSYVLEKRREEKISTMKEFKGGILDGEVYKKILLEVPSYSLHSTRDLALVLRSNILFQNDDFLAISKPYGIPVHGGGDETNNRLNILNSLPILAELIRVKKLEAVHRLDKDVTGVMLLAKTDQMAEDLKRMFKQHKIKKTYCAIVKGVPEHVNGVIDIPIGEGKIGNVQRMVLRPNISGFRGKASKHKKAITRYKVVSTVPGATLLEINPLTGIKHQIRVHLGFGLDCPVIGDHKYSSLTKLVPQKLPGSVLHRLGVRQSRVRDLPMLLHSLAVTLPIIGPRGTEIAIGAIPPKFFRMTLKALKLSSMRYRLTGEYSDFIFGDNNDLKRGS